MRDPLATCHTAFFMSSINGFYPSYPTSHSNLPIHPPTRFKKRRGIFFFDSFANRLFSPLIVDTCAYSRTTPIAHTSPLPPSISHCCHKLVAHAYPETLAVGHHMSKPSLCSSSETNGQISSPVRNTSSNAVSQIMSNSSRLVLSMDEPITRVQAGLCSSALNCPNRQVNASSVSKTKSGSILARDPCVLHEIHTLGKNMARRIHPRVESRENSRLECHCAKECPDSFFARRRWSERDRGKIIFARGMRENHHGRSRARKCATDTLM